MYFSSSWSYVDEAWNSLMILDTHINDELDSLTVEVERLIWIIILRNVLNKLKISRRYNAAQ